MMRPFHSIILFGLLATSMLPLASYADELPEGLKLATVSIDRSDKEAVKRGAKFFATNCMSCHTAVYLRYNQVAKEAGILYEKMPINVKSWPNDVKPPDLSLEASIRGVDWLYTYLHSFYQDTKRPTGANNLLVPNTAMPNILAPYQGEQILVKDPENTGALYSALNWYDLVKLEKQGSMTPEQFDATITDVVSFLAYAAEPYHEQQHTIGWWVLIFLVIMFVLTYYLKQEYWKDVKKHKEHREDNHH